MNPGLKYTLARFGILLVCLIPAVFLFPTANLLLKLLIAFVVSAAASFFLLRRWRDEVAEQLSATAARRGEEKQRLRAALAGEDEPSTEGKHAAKEASSEDDAADQNDDAAENDDAAGKDDAAGNDEAEKKDPEQKG